MRPLEITLGLILLLTFILLISNDIFKRHRCTEGITAISLIMYHPWYPYHLRRLSLANDTNVHSIRYLYILNYCAVIKDSYAKTEMV